MPPILGKRKRRDQVQTSDTDFKSRPDEDASQRLQDLLQQHFEAKFKPLKVLNQKVQTQQDIRTQPVVDETESDWTGISEAEDDEVAPIIRYDEPQSSRVDVPKDELKIFMVRVKDFHFSKRWLIAFALSRQSLHLSSTSRRQQPNINSPSKPVLES